jgi:hypothetical protein
MTSQGTTNNIVFPRNGGIIHMNNAEILMDNLDDYRRQQMEAACKVSYDKVEELYKEISICYPEVRHLLAKLDGAYGERQEDMGLEFIRYTLESNI